eukprot:TRINITY_DN1395_c0_g2_i10.p1 TRINITY_DN1395_c0_g2~~TRINITY_DN1395_c0_g2_i10.p1  ORF type:complete len:932 (+),score=239.52 TRINITY_DN1395_c0_g2_i10:399-3194(+)
MEQLIRGPLHSASATQPSPTAAYLLPNTPTMVLDGNLMTNGLLDPTAAYLQQPSPQQMISGMQASQQQHLVMNHNINNPAAVQNDVGVVVLEEGSDWSKIGAQIRTVLEQAQQQALQRRRQLYPSTAPPPESPKLTKSNSSLHLSSNNLNNSNVIDLDAPHSPTRLREEDMHVFGICPTTDPLLLVTCAHCNKTLKASHFCAHLARCPTKSGNLETTSRSSSSSHKSHHADKDHSGSSTKRKQSSNSKSSSKRQKTEDGPVEAPVDERALLKSSTGSTSSTKKSYRKAKKEEEEEQSSASTTSTKKSKREREKEKEREKEREKAEREKAEQEKAEKEREEKEKEAASTGVRGRPRKKKETVAEKAAREEEEKKAQAKQDSKSKKDDPPPKEDAAATAAAAAAAAAAASAASATSNGRAKKKQDSRSKADISSSIQQKVDAWIRLRSTNVRGGKGSGSSSKKHDDLTASSASLSASSSSISLSSSSSSVPTSHKRGHSHDHADEEALVALLDEVGKTTPIPLAIKTYSHHNKLRHIFNTLIPVPPAIGQYCLLAQHVQGSVQSQTQNGLAVLSSGPNSSELSIEQPAVSGQAYSSAPGHPHYPTSQSHPNAINVAPHQTSGLSHVHTTSAAATQAHPTTIAYDASTMDGSKAQMRVVPQGTAATSYVTAKYATSSKDGQQTLYIPQQPSATSQPSQETTAPSPNSSPNASSSSPRRKRKETTRGRGKASATSSSSTTVPVQPATNGVATAIAPQGGTAILAARPAIVHNVDPALAGATAAVAVPAQVGQSGQIYPPRAVYVAYPNTQAGPNGGAGGSIIIAPQTQPQVIGTNTVFRNIRPLPMSVVGVKGAGQQILQFSNGVGHQNPAGHPTVMKNVPIHEQQRPKDPQQKLILTVNPMLGKDNKLHQPIQPAGTATATTATTRNANANNTG